MRWWLPILAGACGCAAPPAPGPADAIRAYAEAVAQGDVEAAAARVEAGMSSGRTPEGVRQALTQDAAESAEEARIVGHALERPAALVEEAVFDLGEGREVVLRRTAVGWRVVSGLPD